MMGQLMRVRGAGRLEAAWPNIWVGRRVAGGNLLVDALVQVSVEARNLGVLHC